LIATKDDGCGAEVVAVVGLKVLVFLVIADGGVFCLVACSIHETSL
jgi:hypothetical protein